MSASFNAPNLDRTGILQQLDRILGNPLFQRSQGLSKFLRYVVEATLSSDAEKLKELVIGTEVFERGDSFDPQTDNVVRVNANRLRGKLAEYHQGTGYSDPVVIDLPRGGYIPNFSSPRPVQQVAPLLPIFNASVGRQHDLNQMHAAFASASGGAGLMMTVSGDAGMGKTTIVEDFLSEIGSKTTTAWIARGSCSERLAKTDAFVPIYDCLDNLTRGKLGGEAAQLMRTSAPAWAWRIASGKGEAEL